MAELIKKLGRAEEDDGRVRSQACRVEQGFCPQIEAKGLDVQGSDLRWRGSARSQQGGPVGTAHVLLSA